MTIRRVVLIGMSGAGKSTVGRMLAERLGWRLLDLDSEIERREGRSIPDMFASSGETAFREIERQVFEEALRVEDVVVATGGGAVANDAVWSPSALEHEQTLTVLLEAPAEVLHQRLVDQQAQDPTGAVRPMLVGADPLSRMSALKADREPWYRRARMVIPVEGWPVDRTVDWVAAVVEQRPATVQLELPAASSRIDVATGVLESLGERIRVRWPRARRVWVIADETVARHHLQRVMEAAEVEGHEIRSLTFPAGESSKSMSGLGGLYDGLLGGGIERSDVLVALGGGVAGDLVGFAAATVLRGVGLVQVPTSLLAMVDSSVGGKTGINHQAGKNLIGAFYQPPIVLIDPNLLTTLPAREYRSGWAEIVKHGLIEPATPAGKSGLLGLIAANADALGERTSPLIGPIIARNVEIKASVVRADEREAGLRAILNFGHTIGHAVEAAGYQLLHGEAISVGLHAAMQLGVALGRVDASRAAMVKAVLEQFELPTSVDARTDEIRRLMLSDKKRVAGDQQWIIPDAHGGVSIDRGVSEQAVDHAIDAIIGGKSG